MPEPVRPRLCRVAGRDTWHIYYQRRRVSTGCTDRGSAEVVLARFLEGLSRPDSTTSGIQAILGAYLDDRRRAQKPGADRLGWAHKQLVTHFGERPVEVVTENECEAYIARRAARGVATGTIRTEMQALRAALGWAAKKGMIPELPAVPLPDRSPARERWLTRPEADKLIAACAGHHIKLFVITALHTAARSGAILGLTWDRVDLERRAIDFREPGRPKSRKGRTRVPINDTLRAALAVAHGLRETEHVIEWAGRRVKSIKTGFNAAAGRAGMPEVTPHVLRHTAATWLAQGGVSIWEVAGYLGHSNTRMVEETYGHHSPEHLAKASRVLG